MSVRSRRNSSYESKDSLTEWAAALGNSSTPLDRLAAPLSVNSGNPGGRLTGMFTAYFDASGNAEQANSFIVVSGYIANNLQWKMFENMWKEIHSRYGVDLPFHMSDFMAATSNPDRYSTQNNARADYVAIGRDQKRAEEFFLNICIAQQTIVNCGISCIVDMRIYTDVSSLIPLREVVPPYALAARSCMVRVHQWEER